MWRRANQPFSKAKWFIALPFVLISLMLAGLLLTGQFVDRASARAIDFADPAFQTQWQRADKPVQDGSSGGRSWTWGPAFSEGKTEAYAESPGNQRLVQYFDKARMEINNPNSNRNDKFFVTNGLLVRDMIAGKIQTGNNSFNVSEVGPAQIPVAGDPDNNGVALLYSSFGPVASIDGGNRAPNQTGQPVVNTLSKDGVPGQNPATAGYGVTSAYYDDNLGHNIPNVFWNFLNQQGPVFVNGSLTNGLVVEWQVAAGLPLTEAYWSRAVVAGQEKDVLVQMFERRTLTFTPTNNDPFKVEMGNVGQHYYKWRYTNPAPTPTPTTVAPTPAPPSTLPPGPANWSGFRKTQVVARPVVRVRPTDGEVWVVGENKAAGGIFASGSNSNFGSVLNLAPGSSGEKVQADFDTDGNLHVFWQERPPNDTFHTYYARINASGKQDWLRQMSKDIAGGKVTGLPSVYFNPGNKHLYLVEEEEGQIVVFYESPDEGATWTNRQVVGNGSGTQTNARVVGDASGNVHVVWSHLMSNGAADLWGADRIGGNWTGAYNITGYNGSWNVGGNSLSAGPNGDAYLSWVSPAPGWVGIGFARYDAASKKWQPRHDNIANTPVGFGGFKNISIAASSNGTIWIGFTLDNQTTPSRSGAYYMVSADNGGSWSELRDITRQENAGDSNLYAYGGNVYFVALFNRVTQFTYRSQ